MIEIFAAILGFLLGFIARNSISNYYTGLPKAKVGDKVRLKQLGESDQDGVIINIVKFKDAHEEYVLKIRGVLETTVKRNQFIIYK